MFKPLYKIVKVINDAMDLDRSMATIEKYIKDLEKTMVKISGMKKYNERVIDDAHHKALYGLKPMYLKQYYGILPIGLGDNRLSKLVAKAKGIGSKLNAAVKRKAREFKAEDNGMVSHWAPRGRPKGGTRISKETEKHISRLRSIIKESNGASKYKLKKLKKEIDRITNHWQAYAPDNDKFRLLIIRAKKNV